VVASVLVVGFAVPVIAAGPAARHSVASATAAVASDAPGRCSPRATPVRPVLAVVGASFSAGVGAGRAALAWPADLGRILHIGVVVSADPGAGYLSLGAGRRGPFRVLAGKLNLARLRPQLVLVQGGHNDIGRPAAALRGSVRALIAQIRCESPNSRIGVVTVFPTGGVASPAARLTDRVIVNAARTADPQVQIFDPITGGWRFPRVGDDLHPSPAGHRWIAEKIATGLMRRV
jgi:lysophospholipase L1-like esterase